MDEHAFGSGGDGGGHARGGGRGDGPLDDDRATALAAALAERALEEIARAGHDWELIERLARQLAAVAARVSARG